MNLSNSVTEIKNIGGEREKLLASLNIHTVGNLVEYFPRDYDDRSNVARIAELKVGESATFTATVASDAQVMRIKRLTVAKILLTDGTGNIEAVWFNQPYMKNNLKRGQLYLFTGKITEKYGRLQVDSPECEPLKPNGEPISGGRIVPIYTTTKKLSQKILRQLIKSVLDEVTPQLTEFIPEKIRLRYKLCERSFAINNIHFPADDESFFEARRRLVFEELFLLQTKLLQLKGTVQAKPVSVKISNYDFEPLLQLFSFPLTNAQKRVVAEMCKDFSSGLVMNRLIQGDVGCGKTAVAMIGAYIAVNNGYQTALMAPTDVLATQHYTGFSEIFGKLGIRCALLTSSLKKKEKQAVYQALEDGEVDIVIGTHALIQETVHFKNLGLVITDEQHRFGVRQRAVLTEKGENPHALVMTATPIPRTLALILYGDLDISVIDELPPGREHVDTFAVHTGYYPRIYSFIRKEIEKGRQAYIICPMIEENEKLQLKAATEYAEQLQSGEFSDLRVDLLHGKMKGDEKQRIMTEFAEGKTDILVSTTVIEVGINVPNATVMLIENAERFGLSALHQLRGRVGRGGGKSYCILVSEAKNKVALERLKTMCSTNDGFVISEKDLSLRGPGDFFGTRQHGLPEMKIANLYKDIDILKLVQQASIDLYRRDPDLLLKENAQLRQKISEIFESDGDKICL
jgi:ATP-dependent DNA helicase RecG